jgi:TRAP-type C4-dicarboxylate transport system permease small subunit
MLFDGKLDVTMISLLRLHQYSIRAAAGINWLSAGLIFLMMVVTTGDVVLRFFRISIPGAYETIGFLSALAISFALPYTAVEKGHIAVDFLVRLFPRPARIVINIFNYLLSIALFSVLAWKSIQYGTVLRASGSVSATLEMPIFPFVYGVAAGSILLCPVLIMGLLLQLKGAEYE